MTTLLQRAVAAAEQLSAEDQDAIASRLLAEVEDERQWNARYAATGSTMAHSPAAQAAGPSPICRSSTANKA